jgi:hypothetical protein
MTAKGSGVIVMLPVTSAMKSHHQVGGFERGQLAERAEAAAA